MLLFWVVVLFCLLIISMISMVSFKFKGYTPVLVVFYCNVLSFLCFILLIIIPIISKHVPNYFILFAIIARHITPFIAAAIISLFVKVPANCSFEDLEK